MEHFVTIHWPDTDVQKSYYFATRAELNAFMEGVCEAAEQGWVNHKIVMDSRESEKQS